MSRRIGSAVVAGLAVLSLVPTGSALAAAPWNHDLASGLGPPDWGSLDPAYEACATGTSQSPIDITGTTRGGGAALRFGYHEHELVVENTGHVIEVPAPDGAHDTLSIGGQTYTLTQFHFHAPSEHTIDGRSFDLEAHLVHTSATGQLAVVGVLMDVGGHPNQLVDEIFEHAPEVAGEETEVDVEFSAAELLPRSTHRGPVSVLTRYFSYSGSLTTPGCSEPVRWLVAKDPITVSADAVEQMHHLVSHFPGYDGFPDNNRPVQPLNGRQVTSRG